jgi:nitrogen fixation/metabolism regulation signal transduction histidine kinase
MDGERRKPVFGEAIQEAMARKGCDLTLEESRHFAQTLLDLISAGVIVADASVKPGVENPDPPREVGHSG